MAALRKSLHNILARASTNIIGYALMQRPGSEFLIRGVKTKWVRPKMKIPPTVPKFDYSGDRNLRLPEFSDDETVLHSLGLTSDEIDETHREMLTLKNANHQVQMDFIFSQIRKEFARSETDDDSLELRIAYITMKIRNQIRHITEKPKDKVLKCRLIENIQKRRKWMTELKQLDTNKFNWLCDKLEITYTPLPRFNFYIPKRARERQEAVKQMLEAKEAKLMALRDRLDKEREQYYRKKDELLEAIKIDKSKLYEEAEELKAIRVQTGQPGDHGPIASKLAYIGPIDREKWWRKHPMVLKKKFGDNYKHRPNRWERKRG